jgi:hypothetical protein
VAPVVPSECQGVTQRPRSDEKRTLRTVVVAPVACRSQQTRATVPWWRRSPRHMRSRAALARLWRRTSATRDRPARQPHTARPTRRVPCRSQAVRSSWPCCAPLRRAQCRLRARRVARVALAETARVRPWAEPRPCVSPRRRVADLHERVRTQPYNPDPNPNPNPNRRLPCSDHLTLTPTTPFRAVITSLELVLGALRRAT